MTSTNAALDLLNSGHITEATSILREAAFRDPSYQTLLNYGVALRYSGEFDKALVYFAKCVTLDPRPPNAFLALGNTSTDLGEWEHALGYYEGAFIRTANSKSAPAAIRQVAMAYAQALLRDHKFAEAWPLWELGRFERSYFALPGTKRWLGEPCNSLLVVCEGGYGDAMLYARWLPLLHSRAKHVSLVIWESMLKFRDWSALGVDEVFGKNEALVPQNFTHTTSCMSLPGIFGMRSVDEIPRDYGLLVGEHGFEFKRIGFCWRAEENSQLRRSRSLDTESASIIADALAQSSDQVVSLVPQKRGLHKSEAFPVPGAVMQDESLLDGWATTAATIRACKLVVTVDTAVAHLSGLCGVPTLLLLPCSSDHKWGTAENQPTDPWYGPHVHYYRNSDPLKWNVEEISACITRL